MALFVRKNLSATDRAARALGGMDYRQHVRVNWQVDEKTLRDVEELLADIPMGIDKAIARACNKVGVFARTRVVKMITKEIVITQAELKRRNVKLTKATVDKQFAKLSITGSRIPISHFKPSQTAKGITYRMKRGAGRTSIPHAFKGNYLTGTPARMKSGHQGVFLRTGAAKITIRRKRGGGYDMAGFNRPRLPITELRGPSIPRLVQNVAEFASGTFNEAMRTRLAKELETQALVLIEQFEKGKVYNVAPF